MLPAESAVCWFLPSLQDLRQIPTRMCLFLLFREYPNFADNLWMSFFPVSPRPCLTCFWIICLINTYQYQHRARDRKRFPQNQGFLLGTQSATLGQNGCHSGYHSHQSCYQNDGRNHHETLSVEQPAGRWWSRHISACFRMVICFWRYHIELALTPAHTPPFRETRLRSSANSCRKSPDFGWLREITGWWMFFFLRPGKSSRYAMDAMKISHWAHGLWLKMVICPLKMWVFKHGNAWANHWSMKVIVDGWLIGYEMVVVDYYT